jgi:dihydropteroate synthase
MGILNLTPDSFSEGGGHGSLEAALAHAWRMVEEGAHIIDVGGESTRPGAQEVDPQEECARVMEAVRSLARHGVCVSIDTRHVEVARQAVLAGASIINDVEGFRDPAMRRLAASTEAGLVAMHMKGSPATMQDSPRYQDVVAEVRDYLESRAIELEAAGIAFERICLDPGPGFGKDAAQTLELVRNLHEFVHLGHPVMAALSRKSYIGKAYGIADPALRDEASATEALMAAELGAHVLRVHDVARTRKALEGLRPYVILGLGCNIALVAHPGEEREGKIAQLNYAIQALCLLPDTQVVDISGFYESEPAYYADQEPFMNTVVLLRTGLAPSVLLAHVQGIEASLGRVRTFANGPRTCDIDILDYQGIVSTEEALTLPHPLLLERDFVVSPLLEILPGHILANGRPVTREAIRVGKATRC